MSTLTVKDQQFIWHPYTQAKTAASPIPIIRGDGVYLFDEQGNKYIDAISSWWVNLHGHAHPYLAQKIYEQAKTLEHVIFAGFTHEPAIRLAERLLRLLPGKFSKLFYSDNGSTAVEVALKMAIQYWKNKHEGTRNKVQGGSRNKILALKNSYHGDTFGAMSVSERGVFTLPFQDYLFEVVFIDPPVKTNIDEISALVHRLSSELACFIYEPLLQGAGGMYMYEADAINELLKVCKLHNIICIADEVMTGFYRTGKMFASEYMHETPDIICLSKGITGGSLPLGTTCCTQNIFDAFISDDKTKTFFHGHSYTANPLACAAANASLDLLQIYDCRLKIEKINKNHLFFIEQLQATNNKPQIKNLRLLGTILAFEIETGTGDGYLNNISSKISEKALKAGVLLRPLGNTVYVLPPYCIKDEELAIVYECIENIVTTI